MRNDGGDEMPVIHLDTIMCRGLIISGTIDDLIAKISAHANTETVKHGDGLVAYIAATIIILGGLSAILADSVRRFLMS